MGASAGYVEFNCIACIAVCIRQGYGIKEVGFSGTGRNVVGRIDGDNLSVNGRGACGHRRQGEKSNEFFHNASGKEVLISSGTAFLWCDLPANFSTAIVLG